MTHGALGALNAILSFAGFVILHDCSLQPHRRNWAKWDRRAPHSYFWTYRSQTVFSKASLLSQNTWFKALYHMPFIPYFVCLIFWCPWSKAASLQGPRRTLKSSDVCHAESERDSIKIMTGKNLSHSPHAWGVSWPSADTGNNVLSFLGM